MHKRRLLAVMGALTLTFGVIAVASAETLKTAHMGITVGWDENGDPVSNFDKINTADCAGEELGEGDILYHFVQSGPDTVANEGGESANLLDVWFTGAADQTDVEADSIQGGPDGGNVDWFVLVNASDTVTLDDAVSDVAPLAPFNEHEHNEHELRVSHICVGDEPGDEPSFEQSFEGETDAASFEQSFEGDTDAPTEPSTDSFGTNGTSGPADGAWLLVVALGVLLASIVVLTPARAKSRR